MRDLREKVLRSVSLVVTDRRWAPPLSAMALGFGLFLGVAIGPGASGTFATGTGQIVAVAPSASEAPAEEAGEGGEPEPFTEPESEPFETEETYYPETEYTGPEEEPLPEEELPAEEPIEEEEEPEGQLLEGTVVHANPAAGSYTMAIAGGELVSIHAPKLPPPGTRLKVEGNPLANNTFGEASRERSGGSRRADLRGVVTFVDPNPLDPTYTVSGRGSSILVHAGPEAASQLPVLGAQATVAVQIEKPAAAEAPPPADPAAPEAAPTCTADPGLKPAPKPAMTAVQRQLEVEAEPATYVDLAGILTAVCPTTGQLALSADDLRESGRDIVLSVPKRFQTADFALGDSILATATIGEDGTLTLAGLASDERTQGAEDAGSTQGDLKR
jgi:hypothetical protein